MTSHIIVILKQIAIFVENDSHAAFSECVNERTAREQKYLKSKTVLNCSKGARGYGLISFRTQSFPKIFGLSSRSSREKMGQELIFGVFVLKNWT